VLTLALDGITTPLGVMARRSRNAYPAMPATTGRTTSRGRKPAMTRALSAARTGSEYTWATGRGGRCADRNYLVIDSPQSASSLVSPDISDIIQLPPRDGRVVAPMVPGNRSKLTGVVRRGAPGRELVNGPDCATGQIATVT